MHSPRTSHPFKQRQRGAVFMIMLVIMVMGVVAFFVGSLSSSALQVKRDEITAKALAQAKEALIGYAASIALTGGAERPGDLPCPDIDDDGVAEAGCGNAAGTTFQWKRLGRLPWKTLGLPDLRDSSGERLWYAVSNNFKKNTPTALLNSDTPGTISILSSTGNVLFDGSNGTGAVAVIIAPGDVLQRQGAPSTQNRSCTIGVDCDPTGICTASPPTSTPKCDPVNYLDIFNEYLDSINSNYPHTLINEDNANFADSSAANGFIQGKITIHDAATNTDRLIVNDQVLVITQDEIMQPVEKRVAGEVRQCLIEYAGPGFPQNMERYPWAVQPSDFPSYADSSAKTFGRIPDTQFVKTCLDGGGNATDPGTNKCSVTPTTGMSNTWGPNCNIQYGTWWANWKEMVFYGVADAYKPNVGVPAANACNTAGACLTVNPDPLPNKKFVVIVAGKMLTGLPQVRSPLANQQIPDNYLETPNSLVSTTTFAQSGVSATFNDTLVFQ